MHVKSRRLYITPATVAPTEAWVARETSTFLDVVEQMGERPRILVRDRDSKFGPMFDAVLEDHEAVAKVLPPCSPNLNAHCERVIQTLRRECLDHFIIVGCRHLNYLTREYALHYNRERPHSSLEHRTPSGPLPVAGLEENEARVIGHERLGGLFRHYERRAA